VSCEGLGGILPRGVPGRKLALASLGVLETALPEDCTMPNLFRAAFTPWILISLAVLPLLSGCGTPKFYPVRGQVLLFGVGLLTDGEVRFQPVSKPDLIATGRIQKDGSFSLTTPGHGSDGVLEGTCKAAVVVEPRQGKPVIDERFADFETSDLQFTVTARAENYFVVEVAPAGQVSRGGPIRGRADPVRKGRR
jgi:hypothetical protein